MLASTVSLSAYGCYHLALYGLTVLLACNKSQDNPDLLYLQTESLFPTLSPTSLLPTAQQLTFDLHTKPCGPAMVVLWSVRHTSFPLQRVLMWVWLSDADTEGIRPFAAHQQTCCRCFLTVFSRGNVCRHFYLLPFYYTVQLYPVQSKGRGGIEWDVYLQW